MEKRKFTTAEKLNIPRYVDTFEEEETVDIIVVQKEISRLEGGRKR